MSFPRNRVERDRCWICEASVPRFLVADRSYDAASEVRCGLSGSLAAVHQSAWSSKSVGMNPHVRFDYRPRVWMCRGDDALLVRQRVSRPVESLKAFHNRVCPRCTAAGLFLTHRRRSGFQMQDLFGLRFHQAICQNCERSFGRAELSRVCGVRAQEKIARTCQAIAFWTRSWSGKPSSI